MLVGFQGSGKSTFLASMWQHFSTPTKDGIVFRAKDEAERMELDSHCAAVQRGEKMVPTTTSREWSFRVQGRNLAGIPVDALTLTYVDYDGAQLKNLFIAPPGSPSRETVNSTVDDALHGYDVILGLLDGAKILKIMQGKQQDQSVEMDELFRLITMRGDKTVHLVITKWDLLHRRYKPSDVARRLREVNTRFDQFCDSQGLKSTTKRLIPVASLGTNGRFREEPSGGLSVDSELRWDVDSVERPIACTLPDALAGELRKLRKIAPGYRSPETNGGPSWDEVRPIIRDVAEVFTLALPVPVALPGGRLVLEGSVTVVLKYLTRLVFWGRSRLRYRFAWRPRITAQSDTAKSLEWVITAWSKRARKISRDKDACYILGPEKTRKRS